MVAGLEVADIFRRHGERYRKRSADNVRPKVPRHEHFDFGCRPALSDAGQGLREPVDRIDIVHFAGLCRTTNYAERAVFLQCFQDIAVAGSA